MLFRIRFETDTSVFLFGGAVRPPSSCGRRSAPSRRSSPSPTGNSRSSAAAAPGAGLIDALEN